MIDTAYPRPTRYRSTWRTLNGQWSFDFFDDYLITTQEHRLAASLSRTIEVPYTYQSPRSGINETDYHPCLIYRKEIVLSDQDRKGRLLLHFGAVDYQISVWIDDTHIGSHVGGYTPFFFDISPWKSQEVITITCEVIDTMSPEQPRGKQSWCNPTACWYIPMSGIWQTVWLESVPDTYIMESISQAHGSVINTSVTLNEPLPSGELKMIVTFSGERIGEISVSCESCRTCELHLEIEDIRYWSSSHPDLYDIELHLIQEKTIIDSVLTYTAFREIAWSPEGIMINGVKTPMRLVLNQGYWPETGYTQPYDLALRDDIELMQSMGFNGCRMHEKYEDPRFYYWADHLGFLVWEESPSFYQFSDAGTSVFRKELKEIITRDYEHPSIIVRVVCNESWGILDIATNKEKQHWLRETVDIARKADSTRIVIDNDGWEHLPEEILTFHSYQHDPELLLEDWNRALHALPAGVHAKQMTVDNAEINENTPLMLTEFGGLTYRPAANGHADWGYGHSFTEEQDFLRVLAELIHCAEHLPDSAGWCYTQFSDVYQEKNGLVNGYREPKASREKIRACIENR
ncbi:MAG: hypothetical protein JXK93_05195 [Sphaerochaetaceae bacterium]|nr:hypothetical protein [Sphaerochaetaceae bacterium]